jgi:hypothetical protein
MLVDVRGFALLLVLALSSCSSGVNVYSAQISVDGTVLVLVVAACLADETVEVDEGVDEVVVRVRVENEPEVDYDCADAVYFELSEPLGDRPLIDASDGDEIEVRVSESVTSVP